MSETENRAKRRNRAAMQERRRKKKRARITKMILIVVGLMVIVAESMLLSDILKNQKKAEQAVSISAGQQNVQQTAEADKGGDAGQEAQGEAAFITRYVFLGDSRYVGMSGYAQEDDIFVCKNGVGYTFFDENMAFLKKNCDANTALIVGLGVNDVYRYKDKYVEKLNQMAQEFECHIYYMLVNPVDEVKEAANGYSVTTAQITAFNNTIREKVDSSITIIDTNTYLNQVGFQTSDGLHYDKETYGLIYNYIRKFIAG